MKELSVIQEVQLKQDFKTMITEIGILESYQVLYEIVRSAELLTEVMIEEQKKHGKNQS